MSDNIKEDIAKLAAHTAALLIKHGMSEKEATIKSVALTGQIPDDELLWAATKKPGIGREGHQKPGKHWIKQGFFNKNAIPAVESADNALGDEQEQGYTLNGTSSPSKKMGEKRLVVNMSNDDRLDKLQDKVRDVLRETKFGSPVSVSLPSGETIVYRRKQYEGRPDPVSYELGRSEARKAKHKRSQAQVEAWNKLGGSRKKSVTDSTVDPKRLKLMASNDNYERNLVEQFPLAYELVEYVQGGGSMGNVSRIMQLKPPEIHGIEDVADTVDWHLLNRGINSEHIETALNKEGNKVLLFMDDRAQPRLPQIKEILNKFGEPRILQKADDMSETTNQPHGFYVFELEPDPSLYVASTADEEDNNWDNDTPQKNANESLEEDDRLQQLAETFESFCSTCGDSLFETSKSAWKQTDETDDKGEMKSKVEFGKKAKKLDKKGRPKASGTGTTYNMDSLDCGNCKTPATPIDEHEFKGYYCARHGERLDKYSRACSPCQESRDRAESTNIACPDCKSKVTMEDASCGVCGTVFMEGETADYAGYMADKLLPFEDNADIVEKNHSWDAAIDEGAAAAKAAKLAAGKAAAKRLAAAGLGLGKIKEDSTSSVAETLANTLFANMEEDTGPF